MYFCKKMFIDIIEQLQWRYATKKFDSTIIIPDIKIVRLKNAFNLTASSYGLQPVKLIIIKNKKLQQRLVKYSMDQQQVAQASHVLLFCIESNIDTEYIKTYFKRVKTIRATPNEILDPFKEFLIKDFKNKSVEDIKLWATKQAYLALGNLLTFCALENIDSCPMEGFNPKSYDELLQLSDKGLETVLVMPIGYRAIDDTFAKLKKVRKSVKESVIEISSHNP